VSRSILARVRLRDCALGTSGAGEQFVIADGTRYGHVIDPRTGWPAQGVVSATVITSAAADADALSTAFLIRGIELARSYCDEHPDTLALLTLDDETERPQLFGTYPGALVELGR
jgi:thiamine biosynthesis lipoprotein